MCRVDVVSEVGRVCRVSKVSEVVGAAGAVGVWQVYLGHEVGEAEECVGFHRRLRRRLLLRVQRRGGAPCLAARRLARLARPLKLKAEDVVDGREHLEG